MLSYGELGDCINSRSFPALHGSELQQNTRPYQVLLV